MNKYRMTIIGAVHPNAMALVEARDDIEVTVIEDAMPPREEIIEKIRGAHGIEVRTAKLPEEVLAEAPDLKIVSRHGVGTFVTDVDFDELEEVYQLRMELAELIGRLKPLPPGPEDVDRFRDLLTECDRLADDPDPKGFARLNMRFFGEVASLIGNQHLRRVTEHLFLLTTRIWMTTVPNDRLAAEITIYRREIADVLTALEIGDLQAVGHINRSHLSMAFTRLRGYAHLADPI